MKASVLQRARYLKQYILHGKGCNILANHHTATHPLAPIEGIAGYLHHPSLLGECLDVMRTHVGGLE